MPAKAPFALYVGAATYGTPHDGNWMRLRFGFATVLFVCFGVGYGFFSTHPTCSYVETATMCM
ncbi:MAG: hypothetical protein M1540_06225 [Candidatus Bathyarchaeota archaeon]|nr:hypothetical protein [Candidatus Bathyarchaeota archaeon]